MLLLIVISSYIASSFLLLKFPIIYQKKRQSFRCRHISHRGGAGENLENTMTAFRYARSKGTDMLELDCHLSLDGEVVVAHDGAFSRTCGVPGRIADTNFSSLPPLLECLSLDFGNEHTARAKNTDRRMPLLREVFEEFPDLAINIDLKDNNDELVHKTSELIKEFKREHLTVWGNFRDVVAKKCRRENPNIPLFFSIKRTLMTVILFWTGILPFLPIKEDFFEVCMPSIFLKYARNLTGISFNTNSINKATNFAVVKNSSTRWSFWLLDKLMMRRTLIDHLKKRGIQVYFWVLNEENEFRRAFELGATGVMTDFPSLLRDFLDRNPEYLSLTESNN